MEKRQQKTLIPVAIEVDDRQIMEAQRITGKQDAASAVKQVLAQALGVVLGGGMLIPAHEAETLSSLLGCRRDGADLVDRVRKVTGVNQDGSLNVTVRIDPAYLGSVKQTAEWAGTDVRNVVESFISHAMIHGWLYRWTPNGVILAFDRDDMETLKAAVGTSMPLGRDVADWIRRQLRRPGAKKDQAAAEAVVS